MRMSKSAWAEAEAYQEVTSLSLTDCVPQFIAGREYFGT